MTHHEIMVINAGSSSIKFASFDSSTLERSLQGSVENIHTVPYLKIKDGNDNILVQEKYDTAKKYEFFYHFIFQFLETRKYHIIAVGHRVVHGGEHYHQPVLISPKIIQDLKSLIPYAPLHQPYNVEAIETIAKLYPSLSQIACFDTAFHWTHPKTAKMFGLPNKMYEEGIRRYGFHGLSYEYIYHQIRDHYPEKENSKIIVAHLGNGASLCAIKEGKSIDSTMGFSTLDGLMMGTRPGSLDAGVLLYLMQFEKMDFEALQNLLYKESGLLGVSENSNDMRKLLEIENKDDHAKTAINLFIYRLQREIGALISILNGCDLLVFTGGIGENSAIIRQKVTDTLQWCGIDIDPALNNASQSLISTPQSRIEVRVIPTNEELIIAQHTANTLDL